MIFSTLIIVNQLVIKQKDTIVMKITKDKITEICILPSILFGGQM